MRFNADIASAVSEIQYTDCLMSTQKGGNLGPGRGPNLGGQSPPGWKPSGPIKNYKKLSSWTS